MTLKTNIFNTCKEKEINGYTCYVFEIEGITHYIFGETQEERFNFMADLINNYGESKQWEQSNIREKKVWKVQKDKRSKGQSG